MDDHALDATSNLALAFGPEIDYVKVHDKSDGNYYILGKARLGHYYKDRPPTRLWMSGREPSTRDGYQPLFPYFADLKEKGAFVCVNGDT
jgi:isoleucyl-tRNA synthetase